MTPLGILRGATLACALLVVVLGLDAQGQDGAAPAGVGSTGAGSTGVGQDGADPVRAALRFAEGRTYRGLVRRVPETGELALDVEAFEVPAVIDWEAIEGFTAIDDNNNPVKVVPRGKGGDVLTVLRGQRFHGRVLAIGDESIEFESHNLGRLVIPREVAGELMFVPEDPMNAAAADEESGVGSGGAEGKGEGGGDADRPGSLALDPPWSDWRAQNDRDGVEVRAGALRMRSTGDSAFREIAADGQRVAVDLAWQGAPEFALIIDGDPAAERHDGIVIEPWDRYLTAYRWNGDTVDLVQAERPLDLDAQGTLRLEIDRDQVRLVTFEPASGDVIDLGLTLDRAPKDDPDATGRLWLRSTGRFVTVHQVLVEGTEPIRDEQGRVVFDRRLSSAEVTGFNVDTRELVTDSGPTDFESGRGVQFLHRSRASELISTKAEQGFGRLSLRDGEVIEVDTVDFRNGSFQVQPRWSDDVIAVALQDVLDLRFNATRTSMAKDAFEYRLGDGKALTAGFQGIHVEDGRAFLRRKEPGFKTIVSAEVDQPLYLKRATRSLFHVSRRKYPHEVVLRNQQSFPARLVGVTGDTLEVRTPFAKESVVLARRDVKALLMEPLRAQSLFASLAVEKKPEADDNMRFIVRGQGQATRTDPAAVTTSKLDRALQVLRTQAGDPGTHLLIAKNGDLLRTNAISLENDVLAVDGGSGGPLSIPLDRLAAWVHVSPDDDVSAAEPDKPEGTAEWTVVFNARATLRMDIVGTDAGSMTFRHPLLGIITVGMDEFDKVEFQRIFTPEKRVFMEWVTRPIAEPLLDPNRQDPEDGEGESGGDDR